MEATGEIGVFRFTSEGSVAAGIRRVEAVAGGDAVRFLHGELDELGRVRGQFRSLQRPSDEEVADLLAQNRRLEKALEEARHAALTSSLEGIMHRAEAIGDLRLAVGRVGPVDMGALRALGESLRERAGSATVGILGSTDPDGSKAYLVVTVSDDLVDRGVQAGRLVGLLAERVDGGGGGRPQLATAGGRSPEKLDEALRYASSLVRDLLA